jgi:hypothetical protein
MSDFSVLSHEYAATASFAEELNSLVLKVKKAHIGSKGADRISNKDLSDARAKLAAFAEDVARALEPVRPGKRAHGEGRTVPDEVLERLLEKERNRLPHFLEDLQKAADSLQERRRLSDRVLEVLDEVCDAADAVTSVAFRRLWRR